MFERSRRVFAISGLILTLITLAIIALGTLDSYKTENRVARDDKAKADATYARQQVEAECIRVSGAVGPECVTDAKRTADYAAQPNHDLKAQQDMAQWAYLTAWFSVIGAAITGAGVIYVALTLHQTRMATEAAQSAVNATWDIGKKQVRAYLSLGDAEFKLTELMKKGDSEVSPHLTFKIAVRNSGQSVAQKLTLSVQGQITVNGKTLSGFSESFPLIDIAANGVEDPEDDVPYPWEVTFPLSLALGVGSAEIIAFVSVTGIDVFKNDLDRVFRAYRFAPDSAYFSDGWNRLIRMSWRPDDAVVERD